MYQKELDYALCCECLDKLTRAEEPVKSKAEYIGKTLNWVFLLQQSNLRDRLTTLIGQYLVGTPELGQRPLEGTLYVTAEGEGVQMRSVQLVEGAWGGGNGSSQGRAPQSS